jgi:opacity protein-like surface antigen
MANEMAKRALRTIIAAALLSWSSPAAAQDPGQRWTGALTIYGWLPAVDGDVTASNSGDSASASFDAADLLDSLDFAAFATGELRHGRFGLIVDTVYTALSNSKTASGPFATRVDGDVTLLLVTTAGAWRFYQHETSFVDLLAGFRFNSADLGISTHRDLPRPISRGVSGNQAWLDPLIGIRIGTAVTERFSLQALADIGGFGMGSDLAYEFYLGASYAFSPRMRMEIGYRFLAIDYSAERAKLDIQLHGPTIGLAIGF